MPVFSVNIHPAATIYKRFVTLFTYWIDFWYINLWYYIHKILFETGQKVVEKMIYLIIMYVSFLLFNIILSNIIHLFFFIPAVKKFLFWCQSQFRTFLWLCHCLNTLYLITPFWVDQNGGNPMEPTKYGL